MNRIGNSSVRRPPTEEREARSPPRPAATVGSAAIYILVFIAGAVLMGLEIIGSRLLAPYFGNSVFVWGSLITVVLSALSIGYYGGGRLADLWPTTTLLNVVFGAVGLMLFAIALFTPPLCSALVVAGLGERTGPLVAATILYLPPSAGMGLVSPIAVRLVTVNIASVGRSAGTLYAVSTVGSIAGTLLTTFLLVPLMSVVLIVKLLSATMLLAAALMFGLNRGFGINYGLAILWILSAVGIWVAGESTLHGTLQADEQLLYDAETPYHNIQVVKRNGAIELRFDHYTESVVTADEPRRSLAPYTEYFHLARIATPQLNRTLFIGAGGGIGPSEFLTVSDDIRIDVVDIDPAVLDVAYRYFGMPESPRLRSVAQDGRIFLQQSNDTYDCIVLDAFTIGGRIPFHLATREFFVLCSERLNSDGVLVMNINSALSGHRAIIYESLSRTLGDVFPQVHAFGVGTGGEPVDESVNVILIATNSKDALSPAGWRQLSESQCPDVACRRRMMRLLEDLVRQPVATNKGVLLTDQYAPLELMPF